MASASPDAFVATINPIQVESDYFPATPENFPTPSTYASSSPPPSSDREDSKKRKRKSWGQPVPDIIPILPPGKRAKTEEEKEQRRCERIVRNRKAAATSRDRKKTEFEELQKKCSELQRQVEEQSAIIAAYQKGGVPLEKPEPSVIDSDLFPPTPASTAVDSKSGASVVRAPSPSNSVISLSNQKDSSPTLAPSLFPKDKVELKFEEDSVFSYGAQSFRNVPTFSDLDDIHHQPDLDVEHFMNSAIGNAMKNPLPAIQSFANFEPSGETHYPAAVLCDLQCQPEASESRLNTNNWRDNVLTIQLMVLNAMFNISANPMLSTMCQILKALEQILPRLLMCQNTLSLILPLMHSLITLPSKENLSRRVFRMAFLRRLLSVTPAAARLFDDAIARRLGELSHARGIQESPRDGVSWASLMTMRWAIRSIEREKIFHQKRFKVVSTSSATTEWDRSSGLSAFEGASIGSCRQPQGRRTCTQGPDVH